ncbi:MAG: 3'-5' exonuclease [Chloroflexi bacterium]|jgi:DNA polymerase-3 subunit epsilon|nr:3'-5' exonuclease [Chloroflexota bacterium]
MRIVAFDVETTGLDPAQHGLAAVAALDMSDGQLFYSAVRPHRGALVNDDALAVNGLSREILLVAPPEEQVILELGRWLAARAPFLPAGCNVRFDLEFLRAAERRTGLPLGLPFRALDVAQAALFAHLRGEITLPDRNGLPGVSLAAIAQALGLQRPAVHRADEDARLTAECIRRLLAL